MVNIVRFPSSHNKPQLLLDGHIYRGKERTVNVHKELVQYWQCTTVESWNDKCKGRVRERAGELFEIAKAPHTCTVDPEAVKAALEKAKQRALTAVSNLTAEGLLAPTLLSTSAASSGHEMPVKSEKEEFLYC